MGIPGIPDAVKTKLCVKKTGTGISEMWMIKHGTDCTSDADAIDAYLPVG